MNIQELKSKADNTVASLYAIINEIQSLDAFVDSSEDPDTASLMVQVILEKSEQFEHLTEETRLILKKYLDAQKAAGVPLDFSYSKLYGQILKG